MIKNTTFLFLFFILSFDTFSQNTTFIVKTQIEGLMSRSLYEYKYLSLFGGVTSSDSIPLSQNKQNIDFTKPKIFIRPMFEIEGKLYKPIVIFVIPGDSITFAKHDSVFTNHPLEHQILNKLELFGEHEFRNSSNSIEQQNFILDLIKKKNNERWALLDSNKTEVRPIFYEIISTLILLNEKSDFYHQSNIGNKIESDDQLSKNAKEGLLAEIKVLNTIKPISYDLFGSHINSYFRALVEHLRMRHSDNSVLEIEAKKINIQLNQYLSDLFISELVYQLARNQRLSMRFLYDFYDNCEEQKCIDRVFSVIPYGPMTSQDSELKATSFSTLDGETITWRELVNNFNGKVVYYFIIESNNKKCEESIKKLKAFKANNPDVVINFITKSTNETEWLKTISDLQILSFGKHFRLNPESLLSRVLTEPDLPRGVIISKIGRIVSIHTNDPESEMMKQNLIEANEF